MFNKKVQNNYRTLESKKGAKRKKKIVRERSKRESRLKNRHSLVG